MLNAKVEKHIASLIYIGVPFTTILVITNMVSDPVNVTKLLSSGVIACAIAALLIFKSQRQTWMTSRALTVSFGLFIFTALSATLFSNSPIQQNIYGTFGRNTGLLAYVAMGLIALGASVLTSLNNLKKI